MVVGNARVRAGELRAKLLAPKAGEGRGWLIGDGGGSRERCDGRERMIDARAMERGEEE